MISEELELSIQRAFEIARGKKHEFLTLEHLLLELCNDQDVNNLFKKSNINKPELIKDLNNYINNQLKSIIGDNNTKPLPSASFERVLKRAAQHVQSSGKKEVKSLKYGLRSNVDP